MSRWTNLVIETQVAADLVLSGIRRVSAPPMSGGIFQVVSYDQTFPLHVGLHTYTSGLERLCKLAIACHAFLQNGSFGDVRRYSHRISALLDDLEDLEVSQFTKGDAGYLRRPTGEYDPGLVAWLERYSSGQGRYELLDSLSRDDAEVLNWATWVEFCSRGSVSENVRMSVMMHRATGDAIRDIAAAHDLESAVAPHLEEFDHPIAEASAAVGLAMYRRARWAASILDAVTYYTNQGLPILGEALVELRQTSENFFAYEVARISDPDVVEEELLHHRDAFVTERDEDPRLAEDGRQVGHALRRLVAGDLQGLFDGPFTETFDPELPMSTLDLSRVSENAALLSILMTCAHPHGWKPSCWIPPVGSGGLYTTKPGG